jgi:thiamine kinase-like enzyme
LEINKTDLNNKSTFCHGDFALDNVLITKKYEICLIDPLHNDYENIMWDYAKILQSSMTYWNLIKYQNFQLISNNKKIFITPNEHISMFHRHFLKNLESDNISTITLYLAATLARVAKYAKTEKQLCALLIIINELLTDYSNGTCDLSGTLNSLRW